MEPRGILGIPWGRPWEPWGRHWDPQGRPGHPREALGHAGTPIDYKNIHISTNIQRQKISIAVFEGACSDPSPEGLCRAVLSIQRMTT